MDRNFWPDAKHGSDSVVADERHLYASMALASCVRLVVSNLTEAINFAAMVRPHVECTLGALANEDQAASVANVRGTRTFLDQCRHSNLALSLLSTTPNQRPSGGPLPNHLGFRQRKTAVIVAGVS